jgi:hypothetical protein
LTVVIIVLVASAVGWWLSKRPWTKARVFAALAAWLAALSIMARPGTADTRFYLAATIAASTGSALLIAGIRRWERRAG